MTEEEKDWLLVNRRTLVEANVPALDLLDILVTAKVFLSTRDDYQVIMAETTLVGQIRKLLDALFSKSRADFHVFCEALKKLCPQVLKACTCRPADILENLDEELRSHFETVHQDELRSLSWLKENSDCPPITITKSIHHLAVVGKSRADQMISEQIASSAVDGRRCEHLYSNAEEYDLVKLENIFEDEDSRLPGRVLKCGTVDTTSSTVASAQQRSHESTAVVCVREGKRFLSNSSRQMIGIYGGAGCGKTSTMLHLYSLYTQGQLWRNIFKLFLFWRLRDPEMQQSESLEHLLRALPCHPSHQACVHVAKALCESEGEDVLIVLDGVDELEASRKAFVRKLLDGSALQKACVIATSRPCAVARHYFRHFNSSSLELLGFTEEQVDLYLQ